MIPSVDSKNLSTAGRELVSLTVMAKIISSNHLSSCEQDVKYLLEKYDSDGLRLALALISSNPAMSRADKQYNLDKVTKFFEQGVGSKLYSNAYNEIYKGYDVLDPNAVKATTKSRGRFWGRSK